VGPDPEYSLADPPKDSLINPQIWRGGLRISLMRVVRQLNAVHHKGVRLTLGTFVICRTKNILYEAGLAKLDEIGKLNSTKSASLILTNTDYPNRPYITNPNKLDEYAMRPRNPQPLFISTTKHR
jgi:hypothetical protein